MNIDIRESVERFVLPAVEKPLRYVGGEINMVRKDPSTITMRGVLCFPDVYDIGMSHAGTQILYHIVNSRPSWQLERAYALWADAAKIFHERKIPLYGLESFEPIRTADWVGFSVQYELQYSNIVEMLDIAGIPVLSADRREEDPIVVAGGPCMNNPEPIADFFDAMVIGDGEQAIVDICSAIEDAKRKKIPRSGLLKILSSINGVYVPSLYEVETSGCFAVPSLDGMQQVKPAKIAKLLAGNYPEKPLVPVVEVIHSRLPVEIQRGCTRGCRFCSAGYYYRPVREREVPEIVNSIEAGIAGSGWDEVGLLSLSSADYSSFSCLLEAVNVILSEKRISIGLPSTRIDALTDDDIKALNKVSAASSFTIAPEAGSQRLRDFINKDFTEDTILATLDILLANKPRTIKLYFMTGLPTETEEDIDEIIRLVGLIADKAWRKSKAISVNVSLSPYSPKANTPFQWDALVDSDTLMKRGSRTKHALKRFRNVKVDYREASMTRLETIMSRGDRNVAKIIVEAWKRGARFDGWHEYFNPTLWDEAAAAVGVDVAPYLSAIPLGQALPWSAVSIGVSEKFLLDEREKALAGAVTKDCRRDACTDCDVCDKTIKPVFAKVVASPAQTDTQTKTSAGKVPVPSITKHFRFVYEKIGTMRFLSHRNTMDLMTKALSTSNVPIAYSQGFHPLPRVSFGPPLPLGAAGRCEMFDIVADGSWVPNLHLLNSRLPEGLRIKEVTPLAGKPESINSIVTAAEYSFDLVDNMGIDIEAAVEAFISAESYTVEIEKEGVKSQRDIRSLVYKAGMDRTGKRSIVTATLSMLPGATCRPFDFVKAVFNGCEIHDVLVTRMKCLTGKNGSFAELERR